jgi:hypothetical protein
MRHIVHRRSPLAPRAAWFIVLPFLLVACSDGTGPRVPSTLEKVAWSGEEGIVATRVSSPPTVRVLDSRGQALGGVTVVWSAVSGHGQLSPLTTVSAEDGTATTQWTLGNLAGSQEVVATVEGTDIRTSFEVVARPGPPVNIHAFEGNAQVGMTGEALPVPLVARVVDAYGNGVPAVEVQWVVEAGDGSLSAPTSMTDEDGNALILWTLGEVLGQQSVRATAGVATRLFTAVGGAADFNLTIEAVHLNQAVQDAGGNVGGVARRPGLLRVFLRASDPNTYQPAVRVEFHLPGRGMIGEALIPAPGVGVPTNPSLVTLNDTWNLELSAEQVSAGMTIVATVDPDGEIPVLDTSDNRYPVGTGTASLDVALLAPLNVVFFPIAANNRTGAITEENVGEFMRAVRQFIPSGAITVTVRQPLSTSHDMTTRAGWSSLLPDLQAVRTAEGATDEYYHGIVPDVGGSGIIGIAYVPGSPASGFRSGLTFDQLPGASRTLAHELGHNLGRFHAPSPGEGCGNPANVDADFPYSNGGIGWPGYDILTGALIPASRKDYMGYCSNVWTSDYTYSGILQWRRNDPLVAGAVAAVGAAASGPAAALSFRQADRGPTTTGLLVWGAINSAGVSLNPAFAMETRPSLPDRPGPYTLRGVRRDGAEVFRVSFRGTEVVHGEDPEEAHYAFFVPLDAAQIEAVFRIEVAGPRGRAVQQRRSDPARPRDVAVRVDPAAGGNLRVRWAADEHPMALVRDPATGRVLAIGRGGDVRLARPSSGQDRVDVLLSDGVTSQTVRAQ